MTELVHMWGSAQQLAMIQDDDGFPAIYKLVKAIPEYKELEGQDIPVCCVASTAGWAEANMKWPDLIYFGKGEFVKGGIRARSDQLMDEMINKYLKEEWEKYRDEYEDYEDIFPPEEDLLDDEEEELLPEEDPWEDCYLEDEFE